MYTYITCDLVLFPIGLVVVVVVVVVVGMMIVAMVAVVVEGVIVLGGALVAIGECFPPTVLLF